MDLKTMFPNLNVLWPCWSDYEVRTYDGADYLMPVSNAVVTFYNCAQRPETLVSDALELGRQVFLKVDGLNRLCAGFAVRYGLLGLETGKDVDSFRKGAVAFCYRSVNDPEYGEVLEQFQEELLGLYRHFLRTRGELDEQDVELPVISGRLHYHLTNGLNPKIFWEANSLLAVLHLAYASLIISPVPVLKVCKNCGQVFYNAHAKSEFCGTKCRNYYNVKVYRQREKERLD